MPLAPPVLFTNASQEHPTVGRGHGAIPKTVVWVAQPDNIGPTTIFSQWRVGISHDGLDLGADNRWNSGWPLAKRYCDQTPRLLAKTESNVCLDVPEPLILGEEEILEIRESL